MSIAEIDIVVVVVVVKKTKEMGWEDDDEEKESSGGSRLGMQEPTDEYRSFQLRHMECKAIYDIMKLVIGYSFMILCDDDKI